MYVTTLKWNEKLNVIFTSYMFRATHYSAPSLARITASKNKMKKNNKKTTDKTLTNVNILLMAESPKEK